MSLGLGINTLTGSGQHQVGDLILFELNQYNLLTHMYVINLCLELAMDET